MKRGNRPTGEIVAIILSVIAAVVLVVGGIVVAGILVVGTVLNVQTKLGLWASDYIEYTYGGADRYTASSDFTVDDNISNIKIDWIAGDITVKTGEGDSVRVYESSDSEDPEDIMRHKTDGERLTVKFRASGYYAVMYKKDLTVEIPASLEIKSIVINTVSSEITFEGGSFGDITVSDVSGSVNLKDVKCRELDVDSVSGEVSAVFASQPHEVDIKSVSGDVKLTLPREPEDVDLESVGGKLNVNGDETLLKYESESHSGLGEVEVDTVSGDITIETLG